MKYSKLRESGIPVAGAKEYIWLGDGGRIILIEGRKTYRCSNCGKEIRQNSKNKVLDTCPVCGEKMDALDFMIIIQNPAGELWYPTFKELAEYFNSTEDRDKLYKYIEQVYVNDILVEAPEHEWFLKYLYYLFREEDINYPVPKYMGRKYAFDFFKSIYEGVPIGDALKIYRLH